jgi:ATP-dependent Zn protease
LILDTIARRDPAYAQRIICHEAGHFLVAQCLEIHVIGYSLSAWEAWQQGQTGQGGVAFAPPPSPISGKLLQNYCAVWMAGIAAEKMIYGNSIGGQDDRQQLRSILKMAGCDAAGVVRAENAALLQAQERLTLQRSAFDALLPAFQERRSVTACLELLTAK